jgi:hypothetical protein
VKIKVLTVNFGQDEIQITFYCNNFISYTIVKVRTEEYLNCKVIMEFFDVLDEYGNKAGEIIERNEAHKKGICHRVVQVWVINSKNELLLQKQARF